ncbi:PulJ/GspJ family protein [Kordia sp.]|uniref:PulJ/GspJ family protein n=1 Tax=Kordia sp. TaxID=1965332 RepID=UPI003D27F442
MNKEVHKIKAFTLSEMIIVVLLTVIVVGLAFSVLQLVQKHMYSIQRNFENSTNVTLLEQSLWIDTNRSNSIQYDTYEEKLHFISEIDTVTYALEKAYIIKDIDTFTVSLSEKLFYFEGKETTSDKIDAFKFITEKEYQHRAIFISKRNDATLYMNP